MKDKFERKIDTLRISITDKCNFRCLYCSREFYKFDKKNILSYEEIIIIVKIFTNLGIRKIKITGGEPLMRKGVFNLIKNISSLSKIEDISLTTNGFYLLENIDEILKSRIRINISLDTLDKNKFKFITGLDGFDRVIEGFKKAIEKFCNLKINVVLMSNINFEEIFNLIDFAKEYNLILRFIELMPVYKNLNFWRENFISYKDVLEKITQFRKVHFLSQVDNTKYYMVDNFKVGFITSVSEPFCFRCNKVRIDAKGDLFFCLYGKPVLNLKKILENFQEDKIEELIGKIIYLKPKEKTEFALPLMNIVGG